MNNIEMSLLLMLLGMVGIFVVMGILVGVVFLLNKFTGKKKDNADE